ncbi:MAG: hypothetical protein JKY27_09715 [Magnetovibrio sp.]|nr:hypothetical protein [Magnetovibrio sp.]
MKYSPDGGDVKVGAIMNGGGNMVLTIADQGIGIPKNDLEKVVRPFERTDISRERDIEGTGLGLPLTKGLVEAHGGHLLIESDLGIGTTVTVSLPADRLSA